MPRIYAFGIDSNQLNSQATGLSGDNARISGCPAYIPKNETAI